MESVLGGTETNKESIENMFGINLFTWDGWDEIDTGELTFYNVEFPFESMKKYNGCAVDKNIEGRLVIYDKETASKIIWEGYAVQIPEFLKAVNNAFSSRS